MLPSPNSTYDYPSFMTKGCLFCTWYHSSCAFFVYHLRDCGMALLVLRENGNLLEKTSTLTSIPTYIYNLCITNLKVTSFFLLVLLPTTISPIANILIDLQEKSAIFGCTADANVCVKIQKGVIFRIFGLYFCPFMQF